MRNRASEIRYLTFLPDTFLPLAKGWLVQIIFAKIPNPVLTTSAHLMLEPLVAALETLLAAVCTEVVACFVLTIWNDKVKATEAVPPGEFVPSSMLMSNSGGFVEAAAAAPAPPPPPPLALGTVLLSRALRPFKSMVTLEF